MGVLSRNSEAFMRWKASEGCRRLWRPSAGREGLPPGGILSGGSNRHGVRIFADGSVLKGATSVGQTGRREGLARSAWAEPIGANAGHGESLWRLL